MKKRIISAVLTLIEVIITAATALVAYKAYSNYKAGINMFIEIGSYIKFHFCTDWPNTIGNIYEIPFLVQISAIAFIYLAIILGFLTTNNKIKREFYQQKIERRKEAKKAEVRKVLEKRSIDEKLAKAPDIIEEP